MLEMEEMPRVVPDEPGSLDGLAIATDLAIGFEHQVILVAQERRGCEPGDPGTDDEISNRFHRGNVLTAFAIHSQFCALVPSRFLGAFGVSPRLPLGFRRCGSLG